MNTNTEQSFGKLRSFFWPIYRRELPKVLPMIALFFMIAFIFNILRCLKTSMVVTADVAGAEVVSFLKLGGVLPGAVVLTALIAALMNRFRSETVFYIVVGGYLAYICAFVFWLYPNHSMLRLDLLADTLQQTALSAPGYKGLVAAIRHLNISIFYILCDLWGAMVLGMLFWGYANEISSVEEASRFYAIFALGTNIAGIASGLFAGYVKDLEPIALFANIHSEQWVVLQLVMVLIMGAACMKTFYWLNRKIVCADEINEAKIKQRLTKKKAKYGVIESLKYLMTSRYLAYLVTIVVSYKLVYNLADIMWAHKVKLIYTSNKDYNAYINLITVWASVFAVTIGFLISGNMTRRFGWTVAALVTPVMWLIASFGFFGGMILDGSYVMDIVAGVFANPANLVLLIGSTQMALGRGLHYTIWDQTKEMAFIPLSAEHKRKGKAVTDGLASRFGKSGGSFIYMMLFIFLGDIAATLPYITVMNFVFVGLWIYAVIRLGAMMQQGEDTPAIKPQASKPRLRTATA